MRSDCMKAENGFCIKCKDGYFSKGFYCIPCDESCSKCVSDSYCNECNTTIDSNGNSLYWRPPSRENKEGEEKGICSSVKESKENGKLLHCNGISTNGCLECKSGYYLDEYNQSGDYLQCPDLCKECNQNNKNETIKCYQCNYNSHLNEIQCECDTNFEFDSNEKKCIWKEEIQTQCGKNEELIDQKYCQCKQNYEKINGECVPQCQRNAQKINGECICIEGYKSYDGIQCIKECIGYSFYNKGKCDCIEGYVMKNEKCEYKNGEEKELCKEDEEFIDNKGNCDKKCGKNEIRNIEKKCICI